MARDGSEALRLFDEIEPDLVLLDLMLPKMSGHRRLPRHPGPLARCPSSWSRPRAPRSTPWSALEVGADDYVTKPYRLRELVARIRAVHAPLAAAEPAPHAAGGGAGDDEQSCEAGEVRVDPDQRRVFVRGEEVHLRRKEFELLRLLVENAGRVLTRDVLIDRVWGTDYIGDTKTLDVHVKRLRSRIEADPSDPVLITTVRGVGYRFDDRRADLDRTRSAGSAPSGPARITAGAPEPRGQALGQPDRPVGLAAGLDQGRPDAGPGQGRAVEGVHQHRRRRRRRAGSGRWPAGPGSRGTS